MAGNNIITDGTSYIFDDAAKEEPNAAIFSKDDLTIKGTGLLTVRANFNDGINCNDDLKISAGTTINITAVDDGLVGNESIEIYRQSSGFPHHERKGSDVFLLFLRNNVENHFLFAIMVTILLFIRNCQKT